MGLPTPDSAPATTARFVLELPDGPEWRAVVSGFLVKLSEPDAWDAVGTLTPGEVAEIFEYVLEQWLIREECA